MAQRSDTLARPKEGAGLRVEVDLDTRDALKSLAAERGYSMASFIRVLIGDAVKDPEKTRKRIPKKSRKES